VNPFAALIEPSTHVSAPKPLRKPGRPPHPEHLKLHSYTIRLQRQEIEKLKANGGRWAVREWLKTLPPTP